jgi:hypothetical protein
MKVLNRPMFRMGGPIKEGIMDGIKEPRQRYQDAGQVFKNVQASLQEGQVADPKVLQEAARLEIGNPYKDYREFKPYMTKVVTKPTDLNRVGATAAQDAFDDISGLSSDFDTTERVGGKIVMKPAKDYVGYEPGIDTTTKEFIKGLGDPGVSEGYLKAKAKFENKDKPVVTSTTIQDNMPDRKLDLNKDNTDDDPPIEKTKKERVNTILEGLGYNRAQKNALYDAMIKAGQRISRTGLGAENLVSDIIAETSQSYDKPEKLREAANLMRVQQDLKLDQIEASKDNRPNIQKLAEYYQSEEGGGYSEEVSIRMARNLPTKISEYFTASKAATDQGKTRDATRAATEDGLFGSGVAYKGKIDVSKHDSLSEFLVSDDLKTRGDGVYNVKGEAVVIKGGKVVSRLVIQAQDDKKGWFTS